MNGVVTAFGDAVFLASARFGPGQHGYTPFDFEAFDAAYLDASAATSTLHLSAATTGAHLAYFTVMVPFIHGWGAH